VVQEHRRRVNMLLHERFRIRDENNPLDLPIPEFVRLYRMPPNEVVNLCNILRQYFPRHPNTQQTPMFRKVCGLYLGYRLISFLRQLIFNWNFFMQLLITLAFYASGSYQRILGRSVDAAVSQTTFSRTVREITTALNHPDMLTRYIRFPLTQEEREAVITRYVFFVQCSLLFVMVGCITFCFVSGMNN